MIYPKFLGICLIIFLIQIVNSYQTRNCLSSQFQCNNGDCIPFEKKCDTVKDCADESDETFEHCYDMNCYEDGKCAYGACYNYQSYCNVTKECWDGTDESILECSSDEAIFDNFVRGECRGEIFTQFQCKKSKECINYSNVCNGVADCKDRTDETLELCASTNCVPNSFRCAYGGCIAKTSLCDHVYDCIDGSDENAYICRQRNNLSSSKIWEIYGTLLPGPSPLPIVTPPPPKVEGKGCNIPHSDPARRLRNVYHGLPAFNLSFVPHQVTVRLSCIKGYVLAGTDVNICINGTWLGNWAECRKVCPRNTIVNDITSTSVCTFGGKVIDCERDPLYANTIAHIECAQGYKPKNKNLQYSERICDSEKGWTLNKNFKRIKCSPDCGRTFETVKGLPWIISIFKGDANKRFTFQCLGAIIDPWYVLTAADCFSPTPSHSAYFVVLGNQTIEFNDADEHGYDKSTIGNINLKNDDKLALVKLVSPLKLSAKVRPVCLKVSFGDSIAYTNETLGQPVVKPINNIYYLKHISTNNYLINVNNFTEKFQLDLRQENMKNKN